MSSRNKGEEKFYKVKSFPGYVNQPDITNIREGYLIRGSKNVIIKDNNRIGTRKGFTLYGAENTTPIPIESSDVFVNFKGDERMLRSYDDELEYEYGGAFYKLRDGWTDVGFQFAKNDFWNGGEKVSERLFVNGSANIYSWNGAVTTFASATSNSITKQGTTSWAEEGFRKNHIVKLRVTLTSNSLSTQALSITVGGTAYTFTEGTDWNAGSDINASAEALADAINEEDNGLVAYSELDQIVVSIYDTGDVITAFSGSTNIIVPTLPAKKVIINGTLYTYTGGETTTTLTGVTPDPTSAGYSAGTPIAQDIATYANSDSKGIPEDLDNDLIDVWNNHVLVASTKGQQVFYSAINEIDNYRIRNPRRTGDGARFTLGAPIVGFAVQKNLNIFAGKNDVYEVKYILSDDLTVDTFSIEKLKTSPGEGAQSQNLILPIKNGILYVSNEPAINFLGNIKDIEDIQLENISDLIKIDMENYSFVGGSMHYHNREVYITLPAEDITLIYDMKDGHWQPPQTLPMSSYKTYNQTLYGFGDLQPETYTMFNSTRDRATSDPDEGFAIPAVANFSYMNFGDREQFKFFNEAYFEGYMSKNTVLEIRNLYEIYGCAGESFREISYDKNPEIFCDPQKDGSLGKTSLGKRGLGNGIGTVDETDLPKVHAIVSFGNTGKDFRELGPRFSSNGVDYQWEILTFGYAEDTSQYQGVAIKV